jgi:ABC-type nitrate/sulfonate/bicarbonate transport system substrate-binding protein
MNRNRFLALNATALAGATLAPRAAAAADEVQIGMLRLPSALFAGIDQGYFAAEGIAVKPVFFNSDADLVPALSTGQIDIAMTSPGAALFNALALGVNATIVADSWASGKDVPAGDSAYIMVRKDLAPYGVFKPGDVKGLTVAVTAHGQMTELFADAYLATIKVAASNVNLVDMPLSDMSSAFQNHAIDIASSIDPYATMLAQQDVAVKVTGLSALMPGYVQALMMYGQRLGKVDRVLGLRFLRAFSKANGYLRANAANAAGRAAIAQIYQKYIPLDDPSLYQKIGLAVAPESLKVDVDGKYGLRWQMDQYVKGGLVQTAPNLVKSIDYGFTEALATASKPAPR